MQKIIELLSPAKNLELGKIAINHGADAVYIGSPKFGARQAASNSLSDIESLVNYAHIYGAKVFVALNTLLFDDELEVALKIINQIYEMGADAVIIQDLGLLELDLPPIAIHASTQTNNYELERIKFLDKCGFQRIILARELSIEQIKIIRKNVKCELEFFIHGALCVCFSGQCYLSAAITGRSGNRGECSQPCRSAYDLITSDNKKILTNKHLLSIKDFNASNYLEELIQSGVCSLKIEGRLKDEIYLKNITAHYRLLLDNIFNNNNSFKKSSSGKTSFFFTPDVEHTFNRGYTTYFLDGKRQKIGSPATQKSIGKYIGTLKKSENKYIILDKKHDISNGDGLCFFNNSGVLDGFLVNKVENEKIFPNRFVDIPKKSEIYRNNNFQFIQKLKQNSSERKIIIDLVLKETNSGFELEIKDEDDILSKAHIECEKKLAENVNFSKKQIISQLSKLSSTPFFPNKIYINTSQDYFITISDLNKLRRIAINNLIQNRLIFFNSKSNNYIHVKTNHEYFLKRLDFLANITNKKSIEFYKRHKVESWEHGFELQTKPIKNQLLLRSKFCLKYELELCPKYFQDTNKTNIKNNEILYIKNGKNKFKLSFDCQKCEMLLFK